MPRADERQDRGRRWQGRPRGRRLLEAVLRGEAVRQAAADLRRQHGANAHVGCHPPQQPQRGGDRGRVPHAAHRVEADHLRAGRRGGVRQDNGRRGSPEAAGEGPLPIRHSARLLRRRHPGRCGGDSRGPGGASQRELPAAHDPRRRCDRDDGVGVAQQQRRRHAPGCRTAPDRGLGRLLWEEASHLGRRAGGPGNLARARRCPSRRRQDDRPEVEDAVSRLVARSTGAPPTR